MAPRLKIVIWAICTGFLSACCANVIDGSDGKTIVCYWQSWSHKRPPPYTYNIDDIPVHLCTHLIYSYAKLDNNATSLYLDEEFDTETSGYPHFIDHKRRFPSVKLLLALGDRYGSDLAAWKNNLGDPMKQFQVIKLLYQLLRRYNFDGVHFNWEWPPEVDGLRAAGPNDKSFEKFIWLVRQIFRRQPPFIVSCVVSLPLLNWSNSQDSWITGVHRHMDFIHMSTRSLSLGGDVNPPISERINSSATKFIQASSYDDLTHGVHYLGQLGVPANKLLLEIQFSGLNDPPISRSIHTESPLTIGRKEDLVPYYEILALTKNGVPIYWDERQQSPYIVLENGRRLHYDDTDSVRHKVNQARSLGLSGFVGWSVDMDNFNANYSRKNDLLRAIFEESRKLIHATDISSSQHSSSSFYEATTPMYVTDEKATAKEHDYVHNVTTQGPEYQRTMVPQNSSSIDGGFTSGNPSTSDAFTEERNATAPHQYEGREEEYNTTDGYFLSKSTQTREPEENNTSFRYYSHHDEVTTEFFGTENDTVTTWSEASPHEVTSDDYITTDDYFLTNTTPRQEREENTTELGSSSHDGDFTTENFKTEVSAINSWNVTSTYDWTREAHNTTHDSVPAVTAETPDHKNATAFTSSLHDNFTTEHFTTKSSTMIKSWNATPEYDPEHEAYNTTDGYFQAVTTETPDHENATAFKATSDDNFTTEAFTTERSTMNSWNATPGYDQEHEGYNTTNDYFREKTTETPEHKNATGSGPSLHGGDFTTEHFWTQNNTITSWNATPDYGSSSEAYATHDYFRVITTEAPEHENTTASSSLHDESFTTEDSRTENSTINSWNATSLYNRTHEAYTSTDYYFQAITTETPDHENATAFVYSLHDNFSTEYFRPENNTVNWWNATQENDPEHEAYNTTSEYFRARTTETQEHENTTAFSSFLHENDFTTEYFGTENNTINPVNATSHYDPTREAYTTEEYFRAVTTKAREHENATEFSSLLENDFTTEEFRTENSTYNSWNATPAYDQGPEIYNTTNDYFRTITPETQDGENVTAFSSTLHGNGFTTEFFRTENNTPNSWNTSHYDPSREAYATDDYFREVTTEKREHENATSFISSLPDKFTTDDFRTENSTFNLWNASSQYDPTDEYFTEISTTPEHENATAFRSSLHDQFVTEYFMTENATVNSSNSTFDYEPTAESYTVTDFPKTTETPDYENATAFSSFSHGVDFTNEFVSTEKDTNDTWYFTSTYNPTQEDFTTTTEYFSPKPTTGVASTTDSALNTDQESAYWLCKNKTLTNVPHESDSEFFYRCYNGMPLLRKCGEGQRFNLTLGRCDRVPFESENSPVPQQSPLSNTLMKYFGDLASGKAKLAKDEKLDVNVNYSFSLHGKK